MKKNKKKKSLMDQLTGLVLLVFAVGVLVMIGVVIKEKMPKKAEPEPAKTVSGTSVSQSSVEEVDERYLTVYKSSVSGKDKEHSGSVFSLELNEKNGTYKEYLLSDGEKSEIDHGTFERTEEGIATVNRNEVKNILYFEEDYIISKNAMFEGEVPEGKTFKSTFTNEAEGESKVVMKFTKKGNFSQTIVRKNASLDGSDTKDAASGTYERDGKFIYRTKVVDENEESADLTGDGAAMMPLYIYKNKLCSTYYKLESEADISS